MLKPSLAFDCPATVEDNVTENTQSVSLPHASGALWTLEYPNPQRLTTGGSSNSSLRFPCSLTSPSQLTTDPLSPSGLIVFDYDGVLVDSRDAMIHATNAFCRSHGIKPTINAAAFDTLDPATLVAVARTAAIPEYADFSICTPSFPRVSGRTGTIPHFPRYSKITGESQTQIYDSDCLR